MTLTVETMLNAQEALAVIAKTPMRSADAFVVARVIRAVTAELMDVEASRTRALERYADKLDGDRWQIRDGEHDAFTRDMDALMHTAVTLQLEPIPSSVLADVSLTPAQALSLDALVA